MYTIDILRFKFCALEQVQTSLQPGTVAKKFRFFYFDFRQNFEHFRDDWAYAEPNFLSKCSLGSY